MVERKREESSGDGVVGFRLLRFPRLVSQRKQKQDSWIGARENEHRLRKTVNSSG